MKKVFLCSIICSCALAEINVGSIDVTGGGANLINNQKSTIYSSEFLKNFIDANNDLTQILKYNPSVTYDTSNTTSFNGSSFRPDKISIHGNLYYQNNFSLDGVDITNDIEPGVGSIVHPTKGDETPSLGVYLNTDILESIEVHDSFVPAKYGNFAGGVVDSKSKNPSKDFSAYIKTGFTSSKLTKTLYPDCENSKNPSSCLATIKMFEEDEKLNPDYVKTWKKHSATFGASGFINDKLGILFDYSTLRTIIKKPGDSSIAVRKPYKLNNYSDNFLLKGIYFADNGISITPSILYAPSKEEYNQDMVKDSQGRFEIKQNNLVSKVNLNYENDNFKIDSNLSYSKINHDREVSNPIMKQWRTSDIKNWGNSFYSYEGWLRGMKKQTETFSYDLDTNIFLDNHTINTGLALSSERLNYEIEPSVFYSMPFSLGTNDCLDDTCSKDDSFAGSGQFFKKKTEYNGLVKLNSSYYAFYLEDEFKHNNFTLRFGARADYNDLYKNFNIAPRIKTTYNFNDESSVSLGYARYYGRMPYAYKLNSMYNPEKTFTRTSPTGEWTESKSTYKPVLTNNKLKTPYDDEIAFNYVQAYKNAKFDFKYVFRNSKDQIMTSTSKILGIVEEDGSDKTYYVNKGKIKNHNFALGIKNIDEINLFGIENNFSLIANYNIHKRNLADYTTDTLSILKMLSERVDKNGRNFDPNKIMYDGKIIDANDKPIRSFDQPWGLRIVTDHKFGNFTLVNFIHYESGYWYEKIYEHIVDDTSKLRAYEVDHQKSTIMYDLKLKYEQKIKKNTYYASIDVGNVFNTKRIQSSDGLTLKQGRSFYFEVGAKF